MAVVERHKNTRHIGIGYLKGYGLKSGAVATSVAHDSHNIICVGTSDEDMAFAVNRIAQNRGGIVVVKNGQVLAELPEIAGIISGKPLREVNTLLEDAKKAAHALGRRHGHRPVHDAVLHEPARYPHPALDDPGRGGCEHPAVRMSGIDLSFVPARKVQLPCLRRHHFGGQTSCHARRALPLLLPPRREGADGETAEAAVVREVQEELRSPRKSSVPCG